MNPTSTDLFFFWLLVYIKYAWFLQELVLGFVFVLGFQIYLVWMHIHKHTVAIWTFTFHKIVRVILKAYRPGLWFFLSENSYLLYSFSFYFLQGLSNPLLFCTLFLLFQWLDMFELQFGGKMWLKHINLFEIASTQRKKQWIWQLLQKIEGKWMK